MLWAGIDMDCSSSPIADLLNFGCTNLSFGLRIVKIRGGEKIDEKRQQSMDEDGPTHPFFGFF